MSRCPGLPPPAVRSPAGLLGPMLLRIGVVLVSVLLLGAARTGWSASAVDAPELSHVDGAPTSTVEYGWPVSPHRVLRPFVRPADPYGPGHRGVDLGAPEGAPVYAAADGRVVYAGKVAGRGVVSIEHADRLRTTYEPVRATVHRGAVVHRGQRVGSLRRGHRCDAGSKVACLHWGVRRGERTYLPPLGLLAGGHVRLLPWRAGEG